MEVTATQTLKVQISKEEQRRIVIKSIRDAAKWVDGNYVLDGKLMLREHYSGSHSWSEDIEIRDANQTDLAADHMIKTILSSIQ